jgi:hypothetical protein
MRKAPDCYFFIAKVKGDEENAQVSTFALVYPRMGRK